MERIKRPRLDPLMRNWIISYARLNLWRVHRWYQLEDLVQEGFFCFCKVTLKYPDIKEQEHFMALVQTAFKNRIHDLSRSHSRKPEEIVDPSNAVFDIAVQEDAAFNTLVNQLPVELIKLIRVFVLGRAPPMLRYEEGGRETNNEYMCRIAGLDPEIVNVEQVFREHF